jgi:hypothetical protein
MGVLLTNTVCWAAFERAGLGITGSERCRGCSGRPKWPGKRSGRPASGVAPLRDTGGHPLGDDSDQRRAKRTKRIHGAHKVYDKKTGGHFNGQTVVFLVLVSSKATVPVGFRFHTPSPEWTAWRKEEKRLRRLKVPKSERPGPPAPDPAHPGKAELLLDLVHEFRRSHPEVKIKAVLADALYGAGKFMDYVSSEGEGTQVISQLRANQKVRLRGRERALTAFFTAYPGVAQRLRVRGGEEIDVVVSSARVHVCAHGQKRFVIVLKYPGETEYRSRVATDLSWRTLDIVQTYTLRWLVEVFLEDWKLHEGWGQRAKQPDVEGSSRGLILNLLLDHALFLSPRAANPPEPPGARVHCGQPSPAQPRGGISGLHPLPSDRRQSRRTVLPTGGQGQDPIFPGSLHKTHKRSRPGPTGTHTVATLPGSAGCRHGLNQACP